MTFALSLLLLGCGSGSSATVRLNGSSAPSGGGTVAGAPLLATRNTTRLDSGDPATLAAASALIAFPGASTATRPQTVALADAGDWRAALVASALASPPLRAPLLLTHGRSVGEPARAALDRLRPGAIVRVGARAARPPGALGRSGPLLDGVNPAALAASVAAYAAQTRSTTDNRVLVVSSDAPQFAMPAAAWAAKSGDPILFVQRDAVPQETRDAIGRLGQPRIYVLGPGSVIGAKAIAVLQRLGTVARIAGADPTANAIAFARYIDGDFGWGIVTPGHGLVLLGRSRPADAAAAAILSASGTFGPSLLLDGADALPSALRQYLLDIEPGYTLDPSRGVYNHGWLVGDPGTASLALQAQIDTLLEITPVVRSK
ncbi:MAG: cell wall-binding repeat-containing protein [Solirubrobacteraceae bacterium]